MQRNSMRRTRSASITLALLLSVSLVSVLLFSAPAWGSPDTLRRSLGNMLQAPVDFVLSPVNAGITVAENLDQVTDNPVGQGAYAVLGGLGLVGLEMGTAIARFGVGLVELLPGIALFPFSTTDLPPLFDPEEDFPALMRADNPLAEEPSWVKWVPFLTPFTIDLRAGVRSDWGRY